MTHTHHYTLTVTWTGNTGSGTSSYRSYSRDHLVSVMNKADIAASSDPAFRGDAGKHNPEEMLLAALSSCHMLWYLHLCAEAGVIVTAYTDHAEGVMEETADGGGQFTAVTLHPAVTVQDASMTERANALHHEANRLCYIARSCNFPVHHQPSCITEKI